MTGESVKRDARENRERIVQMAGTSRKKLPKGERREQLLETALSIVRDEGTEALTLGHVAERAGVSKPIAYEHFRTRGGLLIAICSAYDKRQMEAQRQALAKGGETLADMAYIFASSYINCVLDIGPEMGAAFAALSGSEETAEFQQSLRRGYTARYRESFGQIIDLPQNDTGIFMGLLGAAEALAQDAAAGRIARDQAIEALTCIFTSTLQRYPAKQVNAAG